MDAGGGVGLAAVGWGAAALALLAVGTVRAAGWLFVLCVLVALLAGTLAVGRGRTTLGLVLSAFMVPVAAARGLVWVGRTFVAPRDRRSGSGSGSAALRTGLAAAVGLVLVVVFGALFAGADPAFAKLVSGLVPELDAEHVTQWIFVFVVSGAGLLAGGFLLVNPNKFGDAKAPAPRALRPIEWALPVGALVALFALFVGVQVAVLFGDGEYVRRTAGLTFAEYARRGFWQLLVVTLLTLLVLAVAVRKAGRARRGDRILLRVLLGTLAGLTLVIVASAMRRMWVYEQAYGFTRLRLTVSAVELWLGIVFVLVIAAGVRLRAGWLPQAVVGAGVAVLLGLAIINPDGFIAAHNIDRYQQSQRIDVGYLRQLSPDAALELDRLEPKLRECALVDIGREVREHHGWTSFNLARTTARRLRLPAGDYPVADCP